VTSIRLSLVFAELPTQTIIGEASIIQHAALKRQRQRGWFYSLSPYSAWS